MDRSDVSHGSPNTVSAREPDSFPPVDDVFNTLDFVVIDLCVGMPAICPVQDGYTEIDIVTDCDDLSSHRSVNHQCLSHFRSSVDRDLPVVNYFRMLFDNL